MGFGTRILLWQLYLILSVVLYTLWAFPVMWAWNYTMTYLFSLPSINWLHSFSLLFILSQLWAQKVIPTINEGKD